MLIPSALAPGATIGIIAPARWPVPEQLAQGKAWLESQGFKVKSHPHLVAREGRLAGQDAVRAAAINDMFADPEIQAILCVRGGTGSFRLLDLVDYELVKANPKIFCGFSDITTLLLALWQQTGLVTYHGPLLWNFSRTDGDPRTAQDWLTLLGGQVSLTGKNFVTGTVTAGKTEGKLIGGNLSLLRNLLGTKFDWSAEDSILFIEDIDEPLYKIDHMVWQLQQAGKFNGVRGVIVGEFMPHADDINPQPGDIPYGRSLTDILCEYLPGDIPVCTHFPCGHGRYLTTLPLGVNAALEVAQGHANLRFLERAVQPE